MDTMQAVRKSVEDLRTEIIRLKANTKYWKRMNYTFSCLIGKRYSKGRRHQAHSNYFGTYK